jgi:hypothetical protein
MVFVAQASRSASVIREYGTISNLLMEESSSKLDAKN